MDPTNDLMLDFRSPCGEFKLTFEDNGKVAYAYLKQGKNIVGDVWLYNRCPTPDEPEWKDRTKLPFANCKAYMKAAGHLSKPVTLDDVRVGRQYEDAQPKVLIYLFGDLVALVGNGDKPGCSRFASKDGPLAKVLAT